MDNPAMEIWASLAMFKLKSLNLKFPPHFKACIWLTLFLCLEKISVNQKKFD